MKAQPTNNQSLKSHGITKSVNFGIKASGLHHILGILRNQLYSDKVLAVIREYTCNAVDAQVEAGCGERPIEVTIPNTMNPYFKVRDFGVALTDEDIQNVYAFYGESTKRNTNDQIGMLGIGSKAAFAYGDNFVINSFLNGKKHVYNAFIDPSQVGQISKLGVEDTDEENGIEIIVPVKEEDESEFSTKAEDLFKWYNVRPIIKGRNQFEYDDAETLFSGDGWRWLNKKRERHHYRSNNDAMVVMGNIGYPIDYYALNADKDQEGLREMLCENLVLEMPIGDLEISASREKLQYTDFTRKKLIAKLESARQEIADSVAKEFDDCKTLFECKCLYGTVFDYGNNLYQLRDILKDKLTHKGKSIDGEEFNTYEYESIKLHKMAIPRRSGACRYRPNETTALKCNKDTMVVLNDLGHRRGLLGRTLGAILEDKKTVYVLEYKDGKDKAKWLKKTGFDAPTTKLSDLPQRKLADFSEHGYGTQSSAGTSYTKDKKHTSQEFVLNWKKLDDQGWSSAKSIYWDAAEVDIENDSGVYFILDRFNVQGIKGDGYGTFQGDCSPRVLTGLKDNLKLLGIKVPKLIGVKLKSAEKVEANENMVLFWDWVKQEMTDAIKNLDLEQKYVDRQQAQQVDSDWVSLDQERLHIIRDGVKTDMENSLWKDFYFKHIEMSHETQKDKLDGFRRIAKDLEIEINTELKPKYDLVKLKDKVEKRYEMFSLVENWSWRFQTEDAKKIANYITVIDICNAKQG